MARELIIYADGGSRGNPGQAAYGALVCEGDKVLIEALPPITLLNMKG
jgi:ribonuclease HI